MLKRIALFGRTLSVNIQQLGGHVAHFFRRFLACTRPGIAAQLVQRRILFRAPGVAADQMQGRHRNIQLGVVSVGQHQVFTFDATCFEGGHPLIATHTVFQVNNRLTGVQFGQVADQGVRVDGATAVLTTARDALAQQVAFTYQRQVIERINESVLGGADHQVTVDYAFQDSNDIPGTLPEGRTKPWGTGQAILAARDLIKEPFLVINADDYYGKEGFKIVHDYMVNEMDDTKDTFDMCMAGFILSNTLSENGPVTRGVCTVDANGYLSKVTETYDVYKAEDGMHAADHDGNPVIVKEDQHVSMNMFGLPASFVKELEKGFPEFLSGVKEGDLKAEYLLPAVIDSCIHNGKGTVRVLETKDKWFGVTYKEDKPAVVASIQKLVDAGVYPKKLF